MLVCGIDFETTGLDTNTDRIVEIGAIIFDATTWMPLREFNALVWDETYPKLTEEVVAINGITQEMLDKEAITPAEMVKQFREFLAPPDMVIDIAGFIAHNAPYDEAMWKAELKRQAKNPPPIPWVCSLRDLKSNRQFKCGKLSHLALDYGIVVNPNVLHRAVDDIRLMGMMLRQAKADFTTMLKFMQTPDIIVAACIPKPWEDGGKGKDAAKAAGFSWQQPKGLDKTFSNRWVKLIKADELETEQRQVPFKLQQL